MLDVIGTAFIINDISYMKILLAVKFCVGYNL
jgi:hypothetical protein